MVLAPQLRQSLEMLQVPILELRAMVQQELERNPTLEEGPVEAPTVEIEPTATPETPDTAENKQEQQLEFEKEYEVLAQLDEEWRDYFLQDAQASSYSSDQEEKRQFLLDSIPQRESLQEHLLSQLNLAELSDADRQVGELIIGSINDDGYLTSTIEDLAASASCDVKHLEDVLMVVQDFHPTGVGARDLRECLLLQLDRQGKGETLAAAVVRDHLEALGGRKFDAIAKALGVKADDVKSAVRVIGTLDPKPGRAHAAEAATYVFPEITVRQVDGKYMVLMNDDQLPHVRISPHYRKLLADAATDPEVRNYVQERIRSGVFLIKSIQQRQKTIHRIASEIVEAQQEFLEHGVSNLRPLTMARIAEIVGVHETTVSRAVSGKYMQTPVGTYEMKYFFTPGIKTADGGEVSNKTVKDMIGNMVAVEDPSSPLSDQEIMAKLEEKGIQIARRTIAKYRIALRIPPSHLRKSL